MTNRRTLAVVTLVVTALASGCDRDEPRPAAIARLTPDTLGDVRGAFNAGSGPRVIVFFSSGCEACDTGSAALQTVIHALRGPVTVLAVWEPIEATDPYPSAKMLGNLRDPRVHQIWDPDHIMSAELRRAELAHPGSPAQASMRMDEAPDGILYDTIAVFPAGSRWETTLPAPVHFDGGVAAVLPRLPGWLASSASPQPRSQ
jgi:hypothetical protein